MKAAIYLRVSTTKQEADNQFNQIQPYCDKAGYEVYRVYTDIVTGSKDSRPEWDLMFQEAHQRKFDVIVFWALDRFSRSGTLYTLQKLNELEKLGIGWESYTEQYFRSIGAFRDVVISIMATLAKIESQRISERTIAGLKGKKRGPDTKKRKPRNDKGMRRK